MTFPYLEKLKLLINTNEIYYYDKIAQTVDFQLLSLWISISPAISKYLDLIFINIREILGHV